jgi:hypothetical protein
MASPDDELKTVAKYILEGVERSAHIAARVRSLEGEGRDTSQAERAMKDLEATLVVLRQRHQCLSLEARSRRLLAALRQRTPAARPAPRRRPAE